MNFASKTYGKSNFPPRVRDWKGYGIVQQCGTCEPLQSPTDIALERMICRTMEERPNKNSRTKYQGASRAKDQAAGGAEDTPARRDDSLQQHGAKKQTLAMISVSLLRERENLRSSTQVRDTLYLATTKAGLNGSAMVPRWSSLMKRKASLASKRFL